MTTQSVAATFQTAQGIALSFQDHSVTDGTQQELTSGGWNQVACSVRGLGAPPALTPGFAARADAWAPEAQSAAREWLARLEASDGGEGA